MSSPDESRDDGSAIHLEATATGQGVVNQAGRDQHIHYSAGTRRVLPGGDGAEAVCPYPGLASFTAEQAAWFFGRDRLTAALVSRLDAGLTEGGPVMVVAASGAGKSSLLRAGLLPKIAAGALTAPGSRRWPRVVFAPGAHPLREAAAALAAVCPGGGVAPAEPGAGDLDSLLAEAAGTLGAGGRAVLVVDQFEQLFRLCEAEEERSAFISWLCDAARASGPGGPAALVACAVRADFYLDCTRYPQLRQALQDNQLIVGAMTPGELREAITCPAEAAGLDLDPGLTELLLADLRAGGQGAGEASLTADDGAGRLPLLAHALQATWRQRHGSILTVEGYRAAGGIEHAIAETAERVYRRWEGDAGREVRGLFLRLVKIGDAGGEDIRRPVPRLALLAAAGTAAGVIDDYTASRLVTQSRETVQITHEALLRAWPRLAGWLDEDRAGQLTRQQVEDDAAAWDVAGRDTSRLYRGARLASATAWAACHSPDLTAAARDFLEVSRRRAHLATITFRACVAVLAALTVATTVFSVVAFQQRSAAVSQRDLAVYNQVLAEAGHLTGSDPAAAAQLLVAAYRMRPGTSLRSSLVSTENQPLPALVRTATSVDDVAVSSAGQTAATLSNGQVTLWDITDLARPRQTGQPLLPAAGERASSVAVSPDGRTLAAGIEDGSITLWDISSPSPPAGGLTVPAYQFNDSVEQVAFSPDGRILATRDYGSNGSTIIKLWSISATRHLRELTTLAVPAGTFWQSIAFSANGRTLAGVFAPATETGGGILLWNITDPSRPRELGQVLAPTGTGMRSAAFSPDGSILAGGSRQGIVTLWSVSRPGQLRVLSPGLSAGSDAVNAAMFSNDGQTLTAVNDDGTARQWDIASPADPRPISRLASTGNTNLQAAAFSSNAQVMITGSFNGIIGFSPVPGAIGTTYADGESAPYAISPDGELLAAARPGGGFSLWNVSNLPQPRLAGKVPAADDSSVNSLAFSPDGRTLAVGATNFGPSDIEGKRQGIALWDITNPARPRQVGGLLNGNGAGSDTAAFSPDGRTLAVADISGAITLWNVTDLARPQPTGGQLIDGDEYPMATLAFSANGRLLAGVTLNGNIAMWDTADISSPRWITFPVNVASVGSVAVAPDGRTVTVEAGDSNPVGGGGGTVTLWDVSDPADARQLSRTLADEGTSEAFSPDGKTLAVASVNGTVTLWDVTDPALPRQNGQALNTGLATQFVDYSPRRSILVTASANETIQLWNTSTAYAVNQVCATTSISPQQWRQYLPQVPYHAPCEV